MLRGISVMLVVVVTAALGWWLTRPPVPDQEAALQEQVLATPRYAEGAEASIALLQETVQELGLPSMSVAVSIDGELAWAAALGVADYAEDREASLNTLYRAGSITKAMTGLAAAKLVQRGELDLDAPIREYVQSFPAKRWEVTARQLGSHTGGIRHYARSGEPGFWSEQFTSHHYDSLKESLELFQEAPLLFEPGTGFQYSTHGFTLLGAAMESASGMSYPDLMAELLWKPAGMENTHLEDFRKEEVNRAVPYVAVYERLIHYEGPNPSYKWPGAGALTTPTDLVRMGSLFLNGEIVGEDLRSELFTPRHLADGSANPEGYALGWRNEQVAGPLTAGDATAVLHHGGTAPGGSSFLLLVPDGDIAVAAMTNILLDNPDAFRHAVYKIAGVFMAMRQHDQEQQASP